jgi:tetratricopeptide (TPR) repeat protein
LIKEKSKRKSSETFIPLQLMLTHKPPPESAEWPRWNAQATLFVRWALGGDSPSRKEAFWRFAARTANGEPATESMFRETFGYGYDQALVELNDYLRIAIKSPIDLHLPKAGSAVSDIRAATDTEILRIKEDWTRLVAAYLKTRSLDAGLLDNRHRAAMRACETGNRDPRLLAAVGLFENDMEHDTSARIFLEAAVESEVVRPRAYYELARLRYATVKNFDGSTISAIEAERAVAPLFLGFGQSPSLKDSYSLAAKICLNSEIVLTPEKLQLLNRGPELFPEDMDLLYNFALLNYRQGRKEEATRLAERGLRLSNHPETRAKFEQLRSK